MLKVGKRFVNKLNKFIPCKCQEDVDNIFKLLEEMTTCDEDEWPKNNLYWDRELYIDCNGDRDKLWDVLIHTDKVHFELSEDKDEHPGVVVRYNKNGGN